MGAIRHGGEGKSRSRDVSEAALVPKNQLYTLKQRSSQPRLCTNALLGGERWTPNEIATGKRRTGTRFPSGGGQTAMTRGHRGATPGWKSSHGASIPPAELGAKSQRVIPRIWAVLGMLEASTPQLKGSSEGEKGQSSSLGAVLAPAHPKGSRICRI